MMNEHKIHVGRCLRPGIHFRRRIMTARAGDRVAAQLPAKIVGVERQVRMITEKSLEFIGRCARSQSRKCEQLDQSVGFDEHRSIAAHRSRWTVENALFIRRHLFPHDIAQRQPRRVICVI